MAAEPVTVLAVHRKKHSSAWIWCPTPGPGKGAGISQRRPWGRGYHGLSKWCSSSEQDRLNSLSTVRISGSLLQSARYLCDTVFLYVALCMWKAAGSAKARCCCYTSEGSAGCCVVHSSPTWELVLLSCKRWSCAQSAALAREKTGSFLQFSFCDLRLKICHALLS